MHNKLLLTVVETPTFQKQSDRLWDTAERHAFIDWIAQNPRAGDVIPGAEGARKVRWGVQGRGKRGGVRVIYFHLNDQGLLVLVAMYAKSEQDLMPAHDIRRS